MTRQVYSLSGAVIYHFLRDLAPQPGKAIVTKSAPNYVEDPAKSDAYPQQKISPGDFQLLLLLLMLRDFSNGPDFFNMRCSAGGNLRDRRGASLSYFLNLGCHGSFTTTLGHGSDCQIASCHGQID